MTFRYLHFFLLLSLTTAGSTVLLAQKSVLGKPAAFNNPEDIPSIQDKIGNETKAPWVVVCDRNNNQTYQNANGATKGTIHFKDWFYVTEIEGNWLHICKADLEGKDGKKIKDDTYQDFGWVEKNKMLLWANSLISPQTKIHEKAFILNKADDIPEILKKADPKIVNIYFGPDAAPSNDPKTIYEFYFIYKSENGRYLIGKDDQFSTLTIENTLVGWVELRNVVLWNTRLALEPNFNEPAFDERKLKKNYQVCAYGNPIPARDHALDGKRDETQVYWSNDPVILKPKDLADENPRRYRGEVVRFPILKCVGDYYRSGVVGEISYRTASEKLQTMDEVYYSHLVAELKKKEVGKNNFDILFVIEGTRNLGEYRGAIIQAIKKMRAELVDVNVVRFGIAIYRDVPEDKHGKLYATKSMTQDLGEIEAFLNQTEFARWEDSDPWTALNFGIMQGLRECKMNSDHTNIVVLIGNCADFSYNAVRLNANTNPKYLVKDESLVEELTKFNVNIIGIQAQNSGDRASNKYQEQVRNLIMQAAVTQFQIYKNAAFVDPKLDLGNPSMPELADGNELLLENGSCYGLLKKPASGNFISSEEIVGTLKTAAGKIHKNVEQMWDKLRLITEEGAAFNEINAGDFAGPMLNIFSALKEEGKFTDEDLIKVIKAKKYKLYAEVFTPRKIAGTQHDAYSIVLFIPENDLKNYLDVLTKLKLGIDKSVDEQRTLLYNTFLELATQYSGNRKSPDQLSIDELRNLMQGIGAEACNMPSRWGSIKISDIQDRKKVPNEEIKKRIEEIIKNTGELQTIRNAGKSYEFSYTTSNETYFWIPLEYTF